MRYSISIFIFFILILTQGCVKNEFSVNFELSDKVDGNFRLQYYASDKRSGFQMDEMVYVEKGKGMAKCITRLPTLVYLFEVNSNVPSLIFYAERGEKITLKGETSNPKLWEVDGNKINKEWTAWRRGNEKALTSNNPEEVNKAVSDYVKKHSSERLSLLLMLTTYDRRINEKGYEELWNSLKGDATEESLIRLVGRIDQLTDSKVSVQNVKSMNFYCLEDTIIKYNPAKYMATLFYFNRNNSALRRATIDSLRSLTKIKDYQNRGMVVTVSFETDTIAWKNSIRNDSIKGGLQAWTFAGEADERIMQLGVPETPYLIVCSKKGEQIYRGTEISKAMKEFKKLIEKDK